MVFSILHSLCIKLRRMEKVCVFRLVPHDARSKLRLTASLASLHSFITHHALLPNARSANYLLSLAPSRLLVDTRSDEGLIIKNTMCEAKRPKNLKKKREVKVRFCMYQQSSNATLQDTC